MDAFSHPTLRTSQSVSNLVDRINTPSQQPRSPRWIDSSTSLLPGSPRKISKNYHPYLVQTTSSSLLSRSPSSRKRSHRDGGSWLGGSPARFISMYSEETQTKSQMFEPQHTGDSVASDVSASGDAGIASRKKGGLWQEWEDRTRSDPCPPSGERRIRKTQSAWGLSATARSSPRKRTLSIHSDLSSSSEVSEVSAISEVSEAYSTPPTSSESDFPTIRASARLHPPKSSDIYANTPPPYRIRTPRQPLSISESSADESDGTLWRTARKVTLRERPSLPVQQGAGEEGKTQEKLDALERKFAALAAGFERLEGFLHPAEVSKGSWVDFPLTDEHFAGAGMLLFVGMGIGVVLGRMMGRR